MNDVIHKQKFPGTKDKSSFLSHCMCPPQLFVYELITPRPFKTFVIRNQSENETELCDKENKPAWTKEVKTHFLMEVNMELISIDPYIQ